MVGVWDSSVGCCDQHVEWFQSRIRYADGRRYDAQVISVLIGTASQLALSDTRSARVVILSTIVD